MLIEYAATEMGFLDDYSDALILSQFQGEDHPFIRKALQDENIHEFHFIMFTNRRQTHP